VALPVCWLDRGAAQPKPGAPPLVACHGAGALPEL
jgi:hypothetical protein